MDPEAACRGYDHLVAFASLLLQFSVARKSGRFIQISGSPTSGGSGRAKRVRPQGEDREVAINNAARLKVAGGVVKGRRLESPDVFLRPMMGKVGEDNKRMCLKGRWCCGKRLVAERLLVSQVYCSVQISGHWVSLASAIAAKTYLGCITRTCEPLCPECLCRRCKGCIWCW